MQAAKCGLDLNRNELADSPDYDMNLKAYPIGMIQKTKYDSSSPKLNLILKIILLKID